MDEGIDLSALVETLAPLFERVKSNPGLLSGALSLVGAGGAPGEKREPPPPHGKESDRRRLLRALSPYLSPERQRVLATVLPLLEAWESVAPLLGKLYPTAGKE